MRRVRGDRAPGGIVGRRLRPGAVRGDRGGHEADPLLSDIARLRVVASMLLWRLPEQGAAMNATLLYRIASVLLILFAAGHTVGFLTFKPPTPEAAAVRDAMHNVHFPLGRSQFTYGGFYVGFGLFVTAYLLFSAFLAWHFGGLARLNPRAIGPMGWAFFTVQLVILALSWIYFFAAPTVFSALVAACLGGAAWLVGGTG
jgi:hypothetical protein